MNLRKHLVRAMILLQIALYSHSAFAGASKEKWKEFMQDQMNLLIRYHFTHLGMDFTYLQNAIALKMNERDQRLALLYTQIQQIQQDLEQKATSTDSRYFRDAAFIKAAADLLVAAQGHDAQTFARLETVRDGQCAPQRLATMSNEFDAASINSISKVVGDLEDAIEKVQKGGAAAKFSVSFTVSMTDDYRFSFPADKTFQGSSSSDWRDALAGTSAATGAYIGSALGAGISVGTAVGAGAAAGSVVPGVGTAVGAAVGFIVGELLGDVIGGSESDRVIESLQADILNVTTALAELRGASSFEILKSNCEIIFNDPDGHEMQKLFKEGIASLNSNSQTSYAGISTAAKGIEQQYHRALGDLVTKTLPHLAANFENAFSKYLLRQTKLSKESQSFFSKSILPLVSELSRPGPTPQVKAEKSQALWNQLIEGDVRYTGDSDFCFTSESAHKNELLYWGPASRAVMRSLREGPSL